MEEQEADDAAGGGPAAEAPAADRSVVVCAICLEEAGNKGGGAPHQGTGQLNGCSHVFCFPCILEWSKVTNSCPLCKQKFSRLIRSVPTANSDECAVVQQVIKVKDKRQEHECDVRELQQTYGDGAEGNSFIDDRSDGEIERDGEGDGDGDDVATELRWLRAQSGGGDEDDTCGTVVFSQDGRRLRNTRARRKRDEIIWSQEQHENRAVTERKRPRVSRQSTIAEVLQRRDTRPDEVRFYHRHQSYTQEDIALDGYSDDSQGERNGSRCVSGPQPSQPSSGSMPLSAGSSAEQYTPTQILVRSNSTTVTSTTSREAGCHRTITSYFPSSQEDTSQRALSPIQLSPASSDESPLECSLSSCFPLPRTLGLAPSQSQSFVSSSAPRRQGRQREGTRNSQSSRRKPAKQRGQVAANKENRPNVQSLFFSIAPSPSSASSTPTVSSQYSEVIHSSPTSDQAFAIPRAPSLRSSTYRVNTPSASSTARLPSSSWPPTSTPSPPPIPSLQSQHQFQALSAVRAELQPLFKKNLISLTEFRDIAKKVSERLIVDERRDLASLSLCLTPRRKQRIRRLVEQELDQVDGAKTS